MKWLIKFQICSWKPLKNYLQSLSFFSKGPVPMCLPHVPPFANAINSDSFSGVLNLVYNDTSSKTPVWQGFTRGWDLRGVSFCHLNLSSLWAGTVSIALAGDFVYLYLCICVCLYFFCHLNLSFLWAGAIYCLQVHRWFVVGTFANRP